MTNQTVVCRNIVGMLDSEGYYYIGFDKKSKFVIVDSSKEKNNKIYYFSEEQK